MLATEIRNYIIKPALEVTNLWSTEAEVLVYGTGWIETAYSHVMQIGAPVNGGLGFFQTESSDYADIVKWLKYPVNRTLNNTIMSACYYTMYPLDATVLVHNIKFAALMCRLHYLRVPGKLSELKSAEDYAEYYKVHYNSFDGSADLTRCISIFKGILDGNQP